MERENKHLTDKELKILTCTLLNQKESILNNLKGARSVVIDKNELSNPIDAASTNIETSEALRLYHREALYLRKIIFALNRISEGQYGVCEDCMCEIPFSRLRARPTAELCLECKESNERSEGSSKKLARSYGKSLADM